MNDVRDEIVTLTAHAVSHCYNGCYASAINKLNQAIGIAYRGEKKATERPSRDVIALMSYLSAQADFIHRLDRLKKENA